MTPMTADQKVTPEEEAAIRKVFELVDAIRRLPVHDQANFVRFVTIELEEIEPEPPSEAEVTTWH